ncbi:MAG TPA: glycosyltransferase family 39 protein [Streptosporangiaceae bacterium]|nr:glycosyltransferase family 39 protein [Streptosporangiaceae bacterium]
MAVAARHGPVLVVAGTMTFLGVWGLARASAMGNDEVISHWVALLPLRQLWHLLRHIDAVHGLYYLLLHGWMAVGTSPAVIRIPSVAAMVAAAALMVVIARRLTGSGWAGLFAGLIMALTPSISYYAQTARSYALVYTCVLGQTLTLLSALEAERPAAARARVTRRWALYAALVTLGAYLNEMALLVLAAHAITVLLARYGRRAAGHWLAASAVGAFLAIPLLWLGYLQRSAVSWIHRPGPHALWLLYQDYFGAAFAAALLVVVCSMVAVLPPGEWERRRRGGADGASGTAWWRSGGVSLPSVAAPLLLVPAGLLLVESRIAAPMYQDRYVLYGEAGAALLAGGGLYRIGRWLAAAKRRRELVALPGVAVCLCTLLLQLGHQYRERLPASRDFNFGGLAFYLAAHAHSGDGVLFINSFYRKAELGYPEQFRKTSDFALAVSPATAASYQGIDKPFAAIRPLMLGHRRIWVIGGLPSPHLTALSRAESLVLLHDFTQVTVRPYKHLWLTLWIRHNRL